MLQAGGDTNYKSINKPWTLLLGHPPCDAHARKSRNYWQHHKSPEEALTCAPRATFTSCSAGVPAALDRDPQKKQSEDYYGKERATLRMRRSFQLLLLRRDLELLPHDRDIELNHSNKSTPKTHTLFFFQQR